MMMLDLVLRTAYPRSYSITGERSSPCSSIKCSATRGLPDVEPISLRCRAGAYWKAQPEIDGRSGSRAGGEDLSVEAPMPALGCTRDDSPCQAGRPDARQQLNAERLYMGGIVVRPVIGASRIALVLSFVPSAQELSSKRHRDESLFR